MVEIKLESSQLPLNPQIETIFNKKASGDGKNAQLSEKTTVASMCESGGGGGDCDACDACYGCDSGCY